LCFICSESVVQHESNGNVHFIIILTWFMHHILWVLDYIIIITVKMTLNIYNTYRFREIIVLDQSNHKTDMSLNISNTYRFREIIVLDQSNHKTDMSLDPY